MKLIKRIVLYGLFFVAAMAVGLGIGYATGYLEKNEVNKEKQTSVQTPFNEDFVLRQLSEKPDVVPVKVPLESPAISRYITSIYAYNHLSDTQKRFYDKVYSVILLKQYDDYPQTDVTTDDLGFIAGIDISEFHLDGDSMFEAWLALMYDKPELYYVEGGALYSYFGCDEAYVLIHSVGEYKTRAARQTVDKAIDSSVAELQDRCKGLYGEEKAAEVCRFLAEKYEYASDAGDVPVINTDTENISSL